MKLLQNPKFTGPAIILLLLLNAALLVLILLRPPAPKAFAPPGREAHAGPRDFIIRELQLDEKQQQQYDLLIKDHRAAMRELQDDVREQRDALVTQLSSNSPDSALVRSIPEKIGKDQEKIENVTFAHFRSLRAICTPAQQTKFDEVMHEALKMMGPPQGPPPGPPPPGREGEQPSPGNN